MSDLEFGSIAPLGRRPQDRADSGQKIDPRIDTGNGDDLPSFGELMVKGAEHVSSLHGDVSTKMKGLVTGETEDVHEVLLAMGKAEVAFNLMLTIRNKLVDTWKEITRIQV